MCDASAVLSAELEIYATPADTARASAAVEAPRAATARARQIVEERFSIPTMVAATTRVYESC